MSPESVDPNEKKDDSNNGGQDDRQGDSTNDDSARYARMEIRDVALTQRMLAGEGICEAMLAEEFAVSTAKTKSGPVFKRIRGSLSAAMEEAGVTNRTLAVKAAQLLDAKTLKVIHGPSNNVVTINDNQTQVRAFEAVTKIRGDIMGDDPEDSGHVSVTIEERRAHQEQIVDRVSTWSIFRSVTVTG